MRAVTHLIARAANVGLLLGFQGIGAAAALIAVLVLTGFIGAEAYGRFAWALSIAGLGALAVQTGLPMTIMASFAPLSLGQSDKLPRSLWRLLWLLISAAVVFLLAATMGQGALPLSRPELVFVPALAAGLALGKIADAVLRAADQPRRAVFAEQVLRVFVLLVGIVVLGSLGVDAPGPYLAAYALASVVGASVFLLPPLFRASDRGAPKLRPALAHVQTSWSNGIGGYLPVFVSGFFLTPEQLAYFALALRLTGPMDYGLVAARALVGARIAGGLKAGDVVLARHLYLKAAALSLGVGVALAVLINAMLYALLAWEPRPVLSDFTDHRLLLILFGLATAYRLSRAALGPAQLVLVLAGDDRAVRFSAICSVIVLAGGLLVGGVFGRADVQMLAVLVYGLTLLSLLAPRIFAVFWGGRSAAKEQPAGEPT